MIIWLFAHEVKLTHQAAHFEPTELFAIVTHQREKVTAVGSTATLGEQFIDPTAQTGSWTLSWSISANARYLLTSRAR
jgi:hypothetical protein